MEFFELILHFVFHFITSEIGICGLLILFVIYICWERDDEILY